MDERSAAMYLGYTKLLSWLSSTPKASGYQTRDWWRESGLPL